jgi:hypothetical protein
VRAGRRPDRTTPRPDSETWPHRRLVPQVDTADRRLSTFAPPPERAHSRESDPDVVQMTPMRGAARCDLFFVRVIRVLGFARPSNGANEPRAAVPGSHKTVGRVGSICVLDGRSNERPPVPDVCDGCDVRTTRQAARRRAPWPEPMTVAPETRPPFTANRPRDTPVPK